ncbi:MAG: DEAD/DEAH box helicase [Candidatus Rokubacteria bacterium]|nr:DEAD/DEAH box helicase [Candidatus Rokubacteria bacterium]
MTAIPGFLPVVAEWFAETYGEPTRPQSEGWAAIAAGHHTLIVAPTGSGKTLAAFLWALDHLYRLGLDGRLEDRVYVVYVSPLKALNNDIEKNLRFPLQGIRERAQARGLSLPELRVAVRTGDTLAPARQAMTRRPPHILITTPESLYILLTAERFRPALTTVQFVIVDEVHALAGSKRGVHLSLSLERLEQLATAPFQRIGCSATVRPLEATARFLTGYAWEGERLVPRPCRVVDAGFERKWQLGVVAPVSDFLTAQSDTIWESLYQDLVQWIGEHRTTLVFTPSRRMAERLARALDERLPAGHVAAHHGSLSRRARLEAEERLKRGELRALVATSSLELGIDIGAIDLVVQVQSPRNIAAALQRIGRSGHLLTRESKGRIVVTKGEELVEAAAIVRAIRERELDELRIPREPLDVLAQQVVAAVAAEPWPVPELYRLVRRSACYRDLEVTDFEAVIRGLSDPLPAEVKGAAPRLSWDRANNRLHARRGSRLLAVTSGGTIADAGLYDVVVHGTDVKVGTLDEEFVMESLPGDVFLLGSRAWRLVKVQADRVIVEDAAGMSPTVPFWRGEHPSRSWELALQVGRLRRDAAERLASSDFDAWAMGELSLDPRAASALRAWLAKGQECLGAMPDDSRFVVESFPDDLGGRQVMLHSVFGMRVNGAWGLALREELRRRYGLLPEVSHVDDGILLAFAPGQTPPPPERIPFLVDPEQLDLLLARALIGSPLFTTRFRHSAVRALFIARMVRGKRTPAWLQRLKADALLEAVRGQPDFPLVAETLRECCHDALDLPRLKVILHRLRAGELSVRSAEGVIPSPFTYPLLLAWDWAYLDAGHAEERRSDAVPMLKAWPAAPGALDPEVIDVVEAELQATTPERRPRDANELAVLLEELGDLDDDEVRARLAGDADRCLEALTGERRITRIAFANGRRAWINSNDVELYARRAERAFQPEALERILLRCLRYRGPMTLATLTDRYGAAEAELRPALQHLESRGLILSGRFRPGDPALQYVHRSVLEEMRRRTLRARRQATSLARPEELQAFLLRWQHCHPDHRLLGAEGLLRVIEPLQGEDFPAAFWEQELLPARLEAYDPAWLDQLGLTGLVVWFPFEPGHPGRLGVALRENLAWLLPRRTSQPELDERAKAVLRQLQVRGASFLQDLCRTTGFGAPELLATLWELLWLGLVTTDTFQTVRQAESRRRPPADRSPDRLRLPPRERPISRREARRRVRERLTRRTHAFGAGTRLPGRWSALAVEDALAPEQQEEEWARLLLSRWGVVSRELARGIEWSRLRGVLTRMEYAGEVLRGYFVEGLSGEQYALEEAVAALKTGTRRTEPLVLANLCDPANLWGSVLPLCRQNGSRLSVSRIPQHAILLRGGAPVLLAAGYGRELIPLAGFTADDLAPAARALQDVLARPPAQRPVRRIEVESWDGRPIRESEAGAALLAAGFYPDGPRLIWDGYPGPRPRR